MAPQNQRRRRSLGRVFAHQAQEIRLSPHWSFWRRVFRLIWEYRLWALAILAMTVAQELAALWPVSLLGQFVDRLGAGELGSVVWLLALATTLQYVTQRANVILQHQMFYRTEFEKRVELVLQEADQGAETDPEAASATHMRVVNAVSGITNATFHLLGSFTPIIIKLVVVAGRLLAYNRLIGLGYLVSLSVPALLTVVFNRNLRVLRDAQYSVISESTGAGVRAIVDGQNPDRRQRFIDVVRERSRILISLVTRHQSFLLIREVALVGSQFAVVVLALSMRDRINLTPGDFTRIVGYTTQVGVAFINTAAVLDAIMSHTRAYHVFEQGRRK